ncbi:MAG: hypothetical protein V1701_00020 [Planctomycetota bacterium]
MKSIEIYIVVSITIIMLAVGVAAILRFVIEGTGEDPDDTTHCPSRLNEEESR